MKRVIVFCVSVLFTISCGDSGTDSYPNIAGRYDYHAYDCHETCWWRYNTYYYDYDSYYTTVVITQKGDGSAWDIKSEGPLRDSDIESMEMIGGVGKLEKNGVMTFDAEGRGKHKRYGYFDFKDDMDGKYSNNVINGKYIGRIYYLSWNLTCEYSETIKLTKL